MSGKLEERRRKWAASIVIPEEETQSGVRWSSEGVGVVVYNVQNRGTGSMRSVGPPLPTSFSYVPTSRSFYHSQVEVWRLPTGRTYFVSAERWDPKPNWHWKVWFFEQQKLLFHLCWPNELFWSQLLRFYNFKQTDLKNLEFQTWSQLQKTEPS